ncbi:MAG: MDR family MFS transporter [Dehalococcoidia bacterium]
MSSKSFSLHSPRTSGLDPRWLPLVVTTVGSFMSILDTNIVNIALPKILDDFDSSLENGQLVVGSYLIALAVVIPLTGFLSERVGMKRLYMFTLFFFVFGSALCGLAWNVESLIAFRVIQGLGGGMLQPLGMAIVFTMITPLERPRFMALLGIPVLIAPIIGPSLGGYLVEYSSWRTVFLINVPVGLFDIFLAYKLLKETELKPETKMDFKGFGLAAVAFPCLLFGFTRGSEIGFDSSFVIGLLIVGAIAFVAFVLVELNHHDPMLRVRLFGDATFRYALLIQWVGMFSLFGLNFIIPLYLQRVQGLSPGDAGRVLLPMGIVAFITMNIAGRMYLKIGPRPLIMSGLSVLALTTFLWSRLGLHAGTVPMMVLASGRGLGLGMFSQNIQLVAYNTLKQSEIPRATGLVNVGQRITGAVSTATLASLLVVALGWTGAPVGSSIAEGTAPLSDMRTAFGDVFIFMTVLSLVGVVLGAFVRDHTLERKQAEERGEAVEERSEALAH